MAAELFVPAGGEAEEKGWMSWASIASQANLPQNPGGRRMEKLLGRSPLLGG